MIVAITCSSTGVTIEKVVPFPATALSTIQSKLFPPEPPEIIGVSKLLSKHPAVMSFPRSMKTGGFVIVIGTEAFAVEPHPSVTVSPTVVEVPGVSV